MYEASFQLQKRPFSATPDDSCFYASGPIQETFHELRQHIEAGQGISVLTAEAGVGKTLICRRLLAELRDSYTVAYLGNANFPTRRAVLQSLLYEFGQAYSRLDEQELRLQLLTALKHFAECGRPAVIVFDEAHLLTDRLLEEVRSLSNLDDAGQPLTRIILCGQPVLEERLTQPALESLNQRIACQIFLEPLTRQQSIEYVAYRLEWAGGDIRNCFTVDACELIAHACNGLPRCINQLCDHSLLLAFVAESGQVTRAFVEEALSDLKQLPLHWNDPLPAAGPADTTRPVSDVLDRSHGDAAQASEESGECGEDECRGTQTPDAADAAQAAMNDPWGDETLSASIEVGSGVEPDFTEHIPEGTAPIPPAAIDREAPSNHFVPMHEVDPPAQSAGPEWGDAVGQVSQESHFVPLEPGTTSIHGTHRWEAGTPADEPAHDSVLEFPGEPLEPLDERNPYMPAASATLASPFEEELVIDRYTAIDAGRAITDEYDELSRAAADARRSTHEQDADPDREVGGWAPDDAIEQLMPLLDEARELESQGAIVHFPAPKSGADHFDAYGERVRFVMEDVPVEEEIGAEVLEVCRNVHEAVEATAAARSGETHSKEDAPTATDPMERMEAAEPDYPMYDVIEPEPWQARHEPEPQHRPPAPAPAPRGRLEQPIPDAPLDHALPNYKSIFSLLRRKQGRKLGR